MSGPAGGIVDAHLHIVDPRFALVANDGYLPPPFTVADYRRRTAALGVEGGAVVSGSFQGDDQDSLVDALARLGPGFVGVTQLPPDSPDARVLELHAAGVRAVRVNLRRGGRERLEGLERLAERVHALAGWHVELYVAGRDLLELEPRVAALPKASVDHLGLDRGALPALVRLAAAGVRVKASGFGRVDLDVPVTLRAIAAVEPGALMFGTDLPSTRAARPFADADLDVVREALGADAARRALRDNARAFYGLPRSAA